MSEIRDADHGTRTSTDDGSNTAGARLSVFLFVPKLTTGGVSTRPVTESTRMKMSEMKNGRPN